MRRPVFYIVDVFAEEKYAGNQLAVFRNTEGLSDPEMQAIAKEMHYSETTFILSEKEREGGFDVRIFTPAEEIPFAGHPTLGTAFILREEVIKSRVETVILNLKVGQIPVNFTDRGEEKGVLWMKQREPEFMQCLDSSLVSDALNLAEEDVDSRFPVEEVSTGLPFIIVPLKTLTSVKRARVNIDKFFKIVENTSAKAVLVFAPETYDPGKDLNVRVFVDYYGIPEDPATGSANGCLAGYLVKNRYFKSSSISIKIEQGCEIGRPSLLLLKAEERQDQTEVLVGGRVVKVARGEFV